MHSFSFETTEELVKHLELEMHVEGGFYRETYRSKDTVETARGTRSKQTVIYYCLPANDYSVWHKIIDLEETLHYHYGGPVIVFMIKDGRIVKEVLGPEGAGKEKVVVAPNTWFAMRPSAIEPYTLMSCSVTPGFEYEDLLLADEELLDLLDPSDHKLARNLLKANS